MTKFTKSQADQAMQWLQDLFDVYDFKAVKADMGKFLLTYVRDIEAADGTPDMVKQACDSWRKNPANRRFPAPGEFLAILEPIVESSKRQAAPAWTEPCSAEEFDAMSLREKARECRLRANFYGDKAGGMDIKGNLIRPEAFAKYHPEEEYWKAQGEHFEGLIRQAKSRERPAQGLHSLAMAAPIARLA